MLISLKTPPCFYNNVSMASTHDIDGYWIEKDARFRQKDIVLDLASTHDSDQGLDRTRLMLLMAKKVGTGRQPKPRFQHVDTNIT